MQIYMLSFAAHNALFLIDDLKHTFYEIIDSAIPQKRNSTLNNFAAYVYYIMQIERSFFLQYKTRFYVTMLTSPTYSYI
jgi:hypothetical protein